jgi:hypothetical protein
MVQMSALKSNFKQTLMTNIENLEAPWRNILSLKNTPIGAILPLLQHQELQVSGVMVVGEQYNFEKIAHLHFFQNEKKQLLLALYGLSISCVTGTIHPYLETHAKKEWYPIFHTMKFKSNYMFMHICKHSLNELASHFIEKSDTYDWLNSSLVENNDTALHLAIRHRHWTWAEWLLDKGVSPFIKNNQNETPISLTAPRHDMLNIFCKTPTVEWYGALHDALVIHRQDTLWCTSLIGRGADVNQIELYDSPVESLLVFAKHGMDMNLGPLPDNLTREQLRVFFMYGRQPMVWKNVIRAFSGDKLLMFIDVFHNGKRVEDEEYRQNVCSRHAISEKSRQLMQLYNK